MAVYQAFRLFCFLILEKKKKSKRFSKNFLGIQAFGVIAICVMFFFFFFIDIESTAIKTYFPVTVAY